MNRDPVPGEEPSSERDRPKTCFPEVSGQAGETLAEQVKKKIG